MKYGELMTCQNSSLLLKNKLSGDTNTNNNRIYNKILDRDWFSARLFVM